ncbi:zinc transporter protein [Moelleriella libera RCEF 2490]|uniref:Zinc transporter protein n=1 Tax=Moelleriella libera RCEF 2490 TaxID=1081109 RepID=A0A168BX95_9HYPO|nr:zinc transporter protein [Moelleriella libera RCEF 2490]
MAGSEDNSGAVFNASSVNIDKAPLREIMCYLQKSNNKYDNRLGLHISSIFVILVVSTAVTFFPVLAARSRRLRIPLSVYLVARYFGAGVIIATAFIHLLDPAYNAIGPKSCVGLTGGWAGYSWPPAIAMSSAMLIFLLDFLADYYVERRHGIVHGPVENLITNSSDADGSGVNKSQLSNNEKLDDDLANFRNLSGDSEAVGRAFRSQIAAFLILEFGIIFHSVIIGLNLGVSGGASFDTLYPVLVFHQSFEGLGIGARLSVIPMPTRWKWLPWALCAAYGLTTPISIAIGLGLHTSYNGKTFTGSIVKGVFDAISAGILLYTGFVEMLARDLLFNPNRTQNKMRLTIMLVSLYLGAGTMALIGKWA